MGYLDFHVNTSSSTTQPAHAELKKITQSRSTIGRFKAALFHSKDKANLTTVNGHSPTPIRVDKLASEMVSSYTGYTAVSNSLQKQNIDLEKFKKKLTKNLTKELRKTNDKNKFDHFLTMNEVSIVFQHVYDKTVNGHGK